MLTISKSWYIGIHYTNLYFSVSFKSFTLKSCKKMLWPS